MRKDQQAAAAAGKESVIIRRDLPF